MKRVLNNKLSPTLKVLTVITAVGLSGSIVWRLWAISSDRLKARRSQEKINSDKTIEGTDSDVVFAPELQETEVINATDRADSNEEESLTNDRASLKLINARAEGQIILSGSDSETSIDHRSNSRRTIKPITSPSELEILDSPGHDTVMVSPVSSPAERVGNDRSWLHLMKRHSFANIHRVVDEGRNKAELATQMVLNFMGQAVEQTNDTCSAVTDVAPASQSMERG